MSFDKGGEVGVLTTLVPIRITILEMQCTGSKMPAPGFGGPQFQNEAWIFVCHLPGVQLEMSV